MRFKITTVLSVAGLLLVASSSAEPAVLIPKSLRKYVESFNKNDHTHFGQAISNEDAADWMAANVPLFECPDKDIEEIYHFRWWTYRKHLKETPDGFVVTEFLPKVSWSGKHNTISCPAGHHFREGRWINDQKYLNDYAVFWFRKGGSPRRYSFWAADSIYQQALVTGDFTNAIELLPDLVKNYQEWEKSRLDSDGLFWQIDDRDGMEVSIGGQGHRGQGKRPTINSYMFGDATAIAAIAKLAGKPGIAATYQAKAAKLRELTLSKLWDPKDQFFKTLTRSEEDSRTPSSSADGSVPRLQWWDRELLGKPQWIQYEFPEAIIVNQVGVYWHDDQSGIRLPKSWHVSYRDGDEWKPVTSWAPYGTAPDRLNVTHFNPVKTKALRLKIQPQDSRVAGLYEWRVLSGEKNIAPIAKPSASFPIKPGSSLKNLNDGEGLKTEKKFVDIRELHAFTPWYFNLPPQNKGYEVAWKQLIDPKGFKAPFGPTTAEQRHPEFKIAYTQHECQWNGPSWPLSTSVTLTGLANVLNHYPQETINKQDYFETLKTYTRSHRLKRADGTVVPWIDENLNPFTGDWISRSRLKVWKNGTWDPGKGGIERGKDYNHSSYCDLIISGLVGLRPGTGQTVVVNPLVPPGAWDWFCLDQVSYHGHILTILWDRKGTRYRKGKGLRIFSDGVEIAQSPTLTKVSGTIVD